MTINSIEYITKKHFRSGISIFVTLLALAIAALSVYITVISGYHPAFAVFAAFCVLSAMFSVVRIISVKAGCALMRSSIAVMAVLFFFTAMSMFTLGYLFLRHGAIQEKINEFLSQTGSAISTEPLVTGILILIISVLLYMASGCAFFCHRYLGAASSCSSGVIRRSGFRVFPILSVMLFLFAAGVTTSIILLSDYSLICGVMANHVALYNAALVILLFLHLLFSGICAKALAYKTFAFKVFEKQIMKVETNADGTVYVPINEDKEPDAEEPLLPGKQHTRQTEHPSGKPFIKEIATPHAVDDFSNPQTIGEADIL